MSDEDKLIKRQMAYYEARSREYDEWVYRTGRYYRGEDNKRQWLAELELVREELELTEPSGKILELACGTGLWTRYLAPRADELLAVDSSPTALELNRSSVVGNRVRHIKADLFSWRPADRFDFVFFGFWLSHVPMNRLESFWRMVADSLTPEGKVFFVDSLLEQGATASNHESVDRSGRAKRKLNDGSEYEIVKVFHEPEELERRLSGWGWQGFVRSTERFFLYSCVRRSSTHVQ